MPVLRHTLALLLSTVALAQPPKPPRDRMACLVIEEKWGLRCRSTQSNKPAEAKFARTAKIGDHWLPDTDDLVTLIIEADIVRILSDPGNIFVLKGDAMIRTAKRIIRG